MMQVRRRRIPGPMVILGEHAFEMEARESTVRLGFGRTGAAWTYAHPTQITTYGSAIGPVAIRDYGMAVRIAVWSIVILFSIRRSSSD